MITFPRYVMRPTLADRRRWGLLLAVVLLALALAAMVRQGADTPWVGYLTPLAGLLAVLGLLTPAALTMPYKLWAGTGHVISAIVSWVAVALLFWCVITPLAVVFRMGGRDALRRNRAGADAGNWRPVAKAAGIRSYFRQY